VLMCPWTNMMNMVASLATRRPIIVGTTFKGKCSIVRPVEHNGLMKMATAD
jgi:hypothetical protein